jgi:hypothetical protein
MLKQALFTMSLILIITMNLFAANSGDVIINELMWTGSKSSSYDEWIELRNKTGNPIDLSGWQLTKKSSGAEGLMLQISSGTIPANGYFLISNYNASTSKINVSPDLVDTDVSLANTQLQIKLYDGQWNGSGNLMDTADDGSGAPATGDNINKYSMMRIDPPGDGTQASNWFTADFANGWDAGATEKGTPASSNYVAGALDHFVINNVTNQKVNVAFSISVTAKDASDVTITSFIGTVDISDITSTITPIISGSFSSGTWTGDVSISQEKAGNQITVTNSSGTEAGTSNSFDVKTGPGAGNVVINELMWMGSFSSTADEWIELKNTTNQEIDLTGWQLTRLSSGTETFMLEIPSGTIPANGFFLISNYNEADSKIGVTPDLVNTAVSLANTKLQIKLYDGQWDGGGMLIDTAGDGTGSPAAGDNTNKYSMMRKDNPGDGTAGINWLTADKNFGWDATATELGTPGFSNDGLDLGDLPATYNLTTIPDDGARHNIGNLYLGTEIDSETDGQESDDAGRAVSDGDDGDGTDDEDGIAVNGTWHDGTNGGAVDVTVTGGPGYLSAWIDWDENNNFTNGGDQVLYMKSVATGSQTIQFDIPQGAISKNDTYDCFARFRLVPDDATALSLTGLFNNGEVEDYYLQFNGIAAPSVTTNAASAVGATSAMLNGTVNANNASTTVTFEFGITVAYGGIVTADQSPVNGTTNTAVGKAITGLTANTTYHYKAVGRNTTFATYGADQTFTTNDDAPLVTTDAASAMGTTSATLNGTVNANNVSTTVTFEFGITVAYGYIVTADQSPVNGTTDTAVSKAITGLTANTTYHYKAVGRNASGATHGADQIFTTNTANAPTVTTTAVSNITSTSANSGGNVTDEGDAAVTTRGDCWSTSANPTTADAKTSDGTGAGVFTSSLTGLTPVTTYHVRAYATNLYGTSYGSDETFTTNPAPDTDGDGVLDIDEGIGDRDGDGIPDNQDYDPTGYFYDESDGKIITGGQIAVTGPGAITIVQDGSSGYYQFFTDGTAGIYTVNVTLPPNYLWSGTCLNQGVLDPTGHANPYVLGNGENSNSGYLMSAACTQYYLQFELQANDPFVFNNNFPLQNMQPTNVVLSSFTAAVENKAVHLNWVTETEPDNAGFNVFRSTHEISDFVQINPSVIPSLGNAFTGANYEYTDQANEISTYYYKLQAISLQDIRSFYGLITVSVTSVNIHKTIIPEDYSLSQNYPNPFNPETKIEFGLPKSEIVKINIYDLSGKLVRNLLSGEKSAGYYTITWNGRDNNGIKVSNGVYLYHFKAGVFLRTKKMLLRK